MKEVENTPNTCVKFFFNHRIIFCETDNVNREPFSKYFTYFLGKYLSFRSNKPNINFSILTSRAFTWTYQVLLQPTQQLPSIRCYIVLTIASNKLI